MAQQAAGGEDPRVTRTRRDVVDAATTALLEEGWAAMTHAEVARRSGYSKATIYSHWPTPVDLVRDAIDHICRDTPPPPRSGVLREDLQAALGLFAQAVTQHDYDRLMAGVIERAGDDAEARELRTRLYRTATSGIRDILSQHLDAAEVGSVLAMLVGAVLVRATYEDSPIDPEFCADITRRALTTTTPR